ncbi:MAG: endonuclease Q family protein [Candidatus Buchananbacteria bacterium]|jgi:uncharacterized protein (TIGR00375 family)
MKFIADLHIHSAYSRGCSKQLTLANIAKWCRYKGINLVSTGDFTHPVWLKSIKQELRPEGNGFYVLKDGTEKTRFVIGSEISCIYTQGGKCRRVHVCILAPSIETAERLNQALLKKGCNLKSDGRPIIGLSAKALAQLCWETDEDFFIFPAHAWTPWYSIFGSKSGFDTIEECFEELTPKIRAIETGLSSDPAMNHRLSMLDNIALLSNSDAHSLANIGREANVFDLSEPDINYSSLIRIIKKNDGKKFISTIEFFPEEGKYHVDGHAACNYSCLPQVSAKNNNLCVVCGKPLILGVMNRISALADRKRYDENKFRPFISLIPLQEIIAEAYGVGKNSKRVMTEYLRLVQICPEFTTLMELNRAGLNKIMDATIAESILKVRMKKVHITPGYDGVFGKVKIKLSLRQE